MSLQLEEAFLVAMFLLVPPLATVVALGLGVLVGNLVRRLPLVKVAFNTGQLLATASSGALVSRALFGPGDPAYNKCSPPSRGRSCSSG